MGKVVRKEVRQRGFFGWVFLLIFFAFNLLMLSWLWTYWGLLGAGLQSTSDAGRVGTFIGGAVGTGMILFVWVAGAVITGLFAILTRGRRTYVEMPVFEEPSLSSLTRACPYCAEDIKREASVCRYCGREVTPERSGVAVAGSVQTVSARRFRLIPSWKVSAATVALGVVALALYAKTPPTEATAKTNYRPNYASNTEEPLAKTAPASVNSPAANSKTGLDYKPNYASNIEGPPAKTAALAITAAPNQPKAAPPAEFRGFKWGIAPTKSMQKVGDGVWKNPKKDLNPYFEVPVAEEGYLFLDGKLYAGQLYFDGIDNFTKVKGALTKQFGNPDFANEALQLFKWKWQNPEVEVRLSYQSNFQRTTVHIARKGTLPRLATEPAKPLTPPAPRADASK